MISFFSPISGRPLSHDTPHSLSDGAGERWPVVDGIPYLRVGSDPLRDAVLVALDAGDAVAALCLLLGENDRWWDGGAAPIADRRRLIEMRDRLTLREAMDLLGWGRVATYFAHRWTDPTYLAGLALLDAHWSEPVTALELACGIGHYARALGKAGTKVIGTDLVWAKLWVARHWVAPEACLVCFDAEAAWPIRVRVDLALMHDALYFLADKERVVAQLRSCSDVLAISHVHNADWPNLSGGHAMSLDAVLALFPDAVMFSDAELTRAMAEARPPVPGGDLARTEAFGLVEGARGAARAPTGPLSIPAMGVPLVRNPLCSAIGPAWPSPRYRDEYGPRATYRCQAVPAQVAMAPEWRDAAARRELVELPDRW